MPLSSPAPKTLPFFPSPAAELRGLLRTWRKEPRPLSDWGVGWGEPLLSFSPGGLCLSAEENGPPVSSWEGLWVTLGLGGCGRPLGGVWQHELAFRPFF